MLSLDFCSSRVGYLLFAQPLIQNCVCVGGGGGLCTASENALFQFLGVAVKYYYRASVYVF